MNDDSFMLELMTDNWKIEVNDTRQSEIGARDAQSHQGDQEEGHTGLTHTADLYLTNGTTATTPEQKAKALNTKFHPPPVEVDTLDIDAFIIGQKIYL